MRMEFKVEGSEGSLYTVAFEITGGSARATCTCAAGAKGQFCKHRTALLNGDDSRVRSGNAPEVARLGPLMHDTKLGVAHAELRAATKTYDEAKQMLDLAKKQLAQAA